jgi:hypothetical protein
MEEKIENTPMACLKNNLQTIPGMGAGVKENGEFNYDISDTL